ncbi:MAG: phosphate acetyltransferase [Desulfobacterales bacterium]|nr:phosphate acetyltransferase [Desulfobacterales bacterium]
MANSLYIAGIEPGSGKSMAALGVMALLTRHVRRVAYFRPVIPDKDKPDNNIELIRRRYSLTASHDEMFACDRDDARRMAAEGSTDKLLKQIVNQYKQLESDNQFVLCEGTDFGGISSAFEFEFNAEVAVNLGSPVLLLVNGRNQKNEDIAGAVDLVQEAFANKGCSIAATIVNRVASDQRDAVAAQFADRGGDNGPVFVLSEIDVLGMPTVKEIAAALKAEILQGTPEGLYRTVQAFKVAAMNFPNFLDHAADGDLVITPGDRADVILASIASAVSDTAPNVAGLLLTGNQTPASQVMRLIEGLPASSAIPVISVATDTFKTAVNANAVPPALIPGDDRKIAAAVGGFEEHVDLKQLEERIQMSRSVRVTPIMFEYALIARAKADRRHIVLPEGEEERILQAAEILQQRGVVDLTLLGDAEAIQAKIGQLGLHLDGVNIIDPATAEQRKAFAAAFYEMRKHKGMTEELAMDTVADVSYFGTLMVQTGQADGMVSGAVHTTGDTIRPALQIIKTLPGTSLVSSVFIMCLADRVLVYGDCAVNPNPNAEQLAEIAVSSAATAQAFGVTPRVAMCSYSTGASGKGQDVDKVREATAIAREKAPELKIEGPIQYDAAVDAGVAKTKLPDSEVAGQATVFVFPDLNTGNNLYKAVQRSANAVAIGPVLQGLNKPVNDLSRGCKVADIFNTVAITAVQAQAGE